LGLHRLTEPFSFVGFALLCWIYPYELGGKSIIQVEKLSLFAVLVEKLSRFEALVEKHDLVKVKS